MSATISYWRAQKRKAEEELRKLGADEDEDEDSNSSSSQDGESSPRDDHGSAASEAAAAPPPAARPSNSSSSQDGESSPRDDHGSAASEAAAAPPPAARPLMPSNLSTEQHATEIKILALAKPLCNKAIPVPGWLGWDLHQRDGKYQANGRKDYLSNTSGALKGFLEGGYWRNSDPAMADPRDLIRFFHANASSRTTVTKFKRRMSTVKTHWGDCAYSLMGRIFCHFANGCSNVDEADAAFKAALDT